MSPEELQRATFGALTSLVSLLTARGPVVLVLEDLHWADPTSVHLTEHLARLAADRPLLILATSRPGTGLSLPAGVPVHQLSLAPLAAQAERELAGSFVGAAASQEVLDTVLLGTEGNPLFLEERLASLVETGALVRDQGVWCLRAGARTEVPQALERLVRSRVDRLSLAARETARAAAVIGVEFSLPLLTAVCDAASPPVMDELCACDLVRQVPVSLLEAAPAPAPDPTFRFRHAMIQEAIYNGLVGAERRLLHGRVAWTLEERSAGSLADVAAILGTHFALAHESERAVWYLQLAGDQATGAFANTEAISSFRGALAVMRDAPLPDGSEAARLSAKLANVLWRTAQRGEARAAYHEALRQVEAGDVLFRAHLLTRLGRLEMAESRRAAAAKALEEAQALFAEKPAEMDDETLDQWLELMVDGWADLEAVTGATERALATLQVVQPLVESRGTPARKTSFYHVRALARVLRNRYRVDDTDISNIQLSAAAAAESDEEKDLGYATYFTGWLLLLKGDLTAAREYLERSLALAERIGEAVLLGESLVLLTIAAIHRHDTETVRSLVHRAVVAADAMASYGLPADARACLAWLAWQDGRPQDVIKIAAQIETLDTTSAYHVTDGVTPYKWVYLWPLIAVHTDAGNVADAVAAARQLLNPEQLYLPDQLDAVVTAACDAWDRDDAAAAAGLLKDGLALAGELCYC